VKARYTLRPRARKDIEQQATYLSQEATPAIGHKFLLSAHETFVLLAAYPEMGWHFRLQHPRLTSLRAFRISRFEKMVVLYLPASTGVEIVRVIHGSRNLLALIGP
jgi:toxin ParE1/3/4